PVLLHRSSLLLHIPLTHAILETVLPRLIMEKLSFDLNVRKESSGSNEAAQYDNINSLLEPDDEDDEEEYLDCEDNEDDGRDAFVLLKNAVRSAVEGSSLKGNGGKRKGLKAENGKFSGHKVCLRNMGPFCTCEMVSKEEFNTCAFFNPTIIQGRVCDQESNFAIKHILANVEAHKEKEIFLAPYLQEYAIFLL
ncbi:hypothetical protein Tco_0865456, partial [Tanacetum coccineum]